MKYLDKVNSKIREAKQAGIAEIHWGEMWEEFLVFLEKNGFVLLDKNVFWGIRHYK
jgi:hypothetical protein